MAYNESHCKSLLLFCAYSATHRLYNAHISHTRSLNKPLKNRIIAFMKNTLFLAIALLFVGCTGTYKSPDITRVDKESGQVQTLTKAKEFENGIVQAFPDIPIPASHQIDLERSVIFTSPSQTVGKIGLVGRGDVDSLYRFFESQMVAQGWSMVNAFQSATSSLYFAKPGRFVAIIIEPTVKGSSRITINVGPE